MAKLSWHSMCLLAMIVLFRLQYTVNGAPNGLVQDYKHVVEATLDLSPDHLATLEVKSTEGLSYKRPNCQEYNISVSNLSVSKIEINTSNLNENVSVALSLHWDGVSVFNKKMTFGDTQHTATLNLKRPLQTNYLLISPTPHVPLSLHLWAHRSDNLKLTKPTLISTQCLRHNSHSATTKTVHTPGHDRHSSKRNSGDVLIAKRSSVGASNHPYTHRPDSLPQFVVFGVLGLALLTVLPLAITGFLCCKRMGAGNAKMDQKLIVDEACPFDSKNNPMNARVDSTRSKTGQGLEKKDSCSKSDSLYRRESFHPLGSPTFSTFGAFVDTDASSEKSTLKKSSKMSVSKETILERTAPLPVVKAKSLDALDTVTPLPHTFTGTPPSHVTDTPPSHVTDTPPSQVTPPSHIRKSLKESTPSLSTSTVSLVPGPSLTHDIPPPASPYTHTSQTLTPIYTIPPEVERVEVRAGRSPVPTRKHKLGTPSRMDSTGSGSMLSLTSSGSVSSGQRHSVNVLSESSEVTTVSTETEQPYTVFRAITRVRDSAGGSRFSTASNTGSVVSYVLTQESVPRREMTSECKVGGAECLAEPRLPMRRVPSPLRTKIDGKSDQIPDIKQRALPPTPDQLLDSRPPHTPLRKTQGVSTLPLKRYKSPLLGSTEVLRDDESIGTRSSEGLHTHKGLDVGTSLTLPAKKRGCNLVLKSITQSDTHNPYHRLESTSSKSTTRGDSLTPTTPPPRPPRTLIDPSRVFDFSSITDCVSGEGGVRSGGVEEAGVCLNCGRRIEDEPYYICVLNSEDGSISDTASNASDTANATNATNASNAVNADTDDTIQDCATTSPTVQGAAPLVSTTETRNPETQVSRPPSPVSPHSIRLPSPTLSGPPLSPAGILSTTDASVCELGATTGEATGDICEGIQELDEEVRSKPPIGHETDTDTPSEEEGLQPGSAICIDCIRKEGPIYHELEPAEIEEILASIDMSAPPIPPRDRPPKPRDPVYERIESVRRNMHRKLILKLSTSSRVVTRVSVDGAYIIKASKPRSLRYKRADSSTDYEHISTDQDTPSSPIYHRASEVHQMGGVSTPSQVDPAKHLRCKPHPPPISRQGSSHDYESLPGSFEGRSMAVNLRGLGAKKGSHDYAFIGPAPSLESLCETPDSPPFVPEGAHRATLMRIDSQGYASVIIPDHTDDSDLDCLQSGREGQCPFHSSLSEDLDSPVLLAPIRPNDYEVPVNCVSVSTSPAEVTSSKMSPRLARQRAVSEAEDTQRRLSTASHDDQPSKGDTSERLSEVQTSKGDTLSQESSPERKSFTDKEESVALSELERSLDEGRSGSIGSTIGRESEVDNEDVFDSGIENCNDIHEPSPQLKSKVQKPSVPPKPRTISLGSVHPTENGQDGGLPHRPRSKTFNSTKIEKPEQENGKPFDKKLRILLNQQTGVIV